MIITVNDADSSTFIGSSAKAVIHDADLMEIVNALKEAGAEAISINNQRIVNSTSIICSGNVTQINGEKIGVPFEIKAIGLIEKLNGALTMPNGYLDLMKRDGVQVKVEKSNEIVIPKYEGVYNFQYAENVE